MVTLLTKLFIKDHENTKDSGVRQAYGMLCGIVGIFFNLILFTTKALAGFFSHSIAITADAFNNLSDAASSIITLVGFKMAGQKPDSGHPFGHGRIEYISGLLVSILIVLMGFELVKSSVSKIFHPEAPEFSPVILGILLFSILVKCYMAFYNRRIGSRISSVAMKATAIDSLSDVVATTVVLIGTIVTYASGIIIDGYCGVLVGMFILYSGFVAAKDTISPLLGQPPEPELVQQINDIVLSYDDVIGIHDLIVHNYGPGRTLISLHAEVPADGNILTLHDTIDTIEHELRQKLNCNAVIHMDPVSTNDPETLSLKAEVNGYLDQIDPKLTMHDFRIVKGPTHTNVIFDLVIPYDYPVSDQEVMGSVTERIRMNHPDFYAVIDVDKAVVQ